MKKDFFKYIAITIAIILLIWWLLVNDNNTSTTPLEENYIEGVSVD